MIDVLVKIVECITKGFTFLASSRTAIVIFASLVTACTGVFAWLLNSVLTIETVLTSLKDYSQAFGSQGELPTDMDTSLGFGIYIMLQVFPCTYNALTT